MFSSIPRAKEKQNLRDCFLHSKHRSQCWKEEWSKCLKFSLGQYREMDFVLHQLMEPLTLSWSSPWFWSPPIINPYLMIQAQPTNVWYTPINLAPSNINQPHFSLSLWLWTDVNPKSQGVTCAINRDSSDPHLQVCLFARTAHSAQRTLLMMKKADETGDEAHRRGLGGSPVRGRLCGVGVHHLPSV